METANAAHLAMAIHRMSTDLKTRESAAISAAVLETRHDATKGEGLFEKLDFVCLFLSLFVT